MEYTIIHGLRGLNLSEEVLNINILKTYEF